MTVKMTKIQRTVFVSMFMLFLVSVFASDSYLPSMPFMAKALGASHNAVRLTISMYLLGLGLAPLILGPLSDQHGRKKVLVWGMLIALGGSIICAQAENITVLIIGRFIQGAGVAAGMSLSRTMLSDVFHGKHLARVASYLGVLLGIIPAMAPTVGGYVQVAFGWRGNFVLLMILIGLMLAWVKFLLPETIRKTSPKASHPKVVLHRYGTLLMNKRFILFPILSLLVFSVYMVYLTISPFLYQVVIGLSPIQYGWLAFAVGAAVIIGSLINTRLVRKFRAETILTMAAGIMLVAALSLVIFGLFGILNIAVLLVPMMLFIIGGQLNFSNAFSTAMLTITIAGGAATALYTTVQMVGSSVASSFAAMVHVRNQEPMALIILLLTLCYGAIVIWLVRPMLSREKSSAENIDAELAYEE